MKFIWGEVWGEISVFPSCEIWWGGRILFLVTGQWDDIFVTGPI
jgi:hypothetical protein